MRILSIGIVRASDDSCNNAPVRVAEDLDEWSGELQRRLRRRTARRNGPDDGLGLRRETFHQLGLATAVREDGRSQSGSRSRTK